MFTFNTPKRTTQVIHCFSWQKMAVPEPPGARPGAPVVPSQLECFVEQELGAHLAANTMSCVFCKAARGPRASAGIRSGIRSDSVSPNL